MTPHLTYGGSANEKAAVSFAVKKIQGGKGAATLDAGTPKQGKEAKIPPAAAAGAPAGNGK